MEKQPQQKIKRLMIEAFMIRFEFSSIRSKGTNYEGSYVVHS